MSLGEAVIATDTKGRITFLNPAAQTMTEWSCDEAMDKPLHNVLTVFDRKTLEPAQFPIDSVIQDETVVHLDDIILLSMSGKRFALTNSAAPIWAEDTPIGVIVSFHEIPEEAAERPEGEEPAAVESPGSVVPICASCKAVQDRGGNWVQAEQFIADRTQLVLTHSFCDDCASKHYPKMFDKS